MVEDQVQPILLTLGTCSYDLGKELLISESGRRLELRPQSTQVLKLLATQANQVVTKEEVISAVWPDISVTDDSIVQCVSDIRKALSDKDRRILRTIPKQGYRLTAEEPKAGLTQNSEAFDLAAFVEFGKDAGANLFVRLSRAEQNNRYWNSLLQYIDTLHGNESSTNKYKQYTDGFLLEYDRPERAIKCALALCNWSIGYNKILLHTEHTTLQIGIDLSKEAKRTGSTTKHLAALAREHEIIVTANVRDFMSAELDCGFVDAGDHKIPGMANKMHCYKAVPRSDGNYLAPILDTNDLLPTIAVIPFTSRSSYSDAMVIGEVLADDVISLLSRSLEVNVISRLSTTEFRRRQPSLEEIWNELRADFVLTGRYYEKNGSLDTEAELVEVRTGSVLWTDRFEGEIGQALDAKESIDWIVRNVQHTIFKQEVSRARNNPLPNLRSYTLLMSAVALMHRLSPESFNAAKAMLSTLIERLPHQPVPLAWMARWYVLRVQQGWSDDPKRDANQALQCTQRALDIDPENVLSLVSEGFVLTNLLHRLDKAEERYDKALDLNPNDAVGRLLRGTLFAFKGQGAQATRDTERALHLTPLDPLRFFFLSLSASACLAAEDYERALKLSQLSLRANRGHTSTLRVQAVAQMRLNQTEDARLTGQKLLSLQPNMRVSTWLQNSPSRNFPVGKAFSETLRDIGIPE